MLRMLERSASAGSASRPAARTTTRMSSGRRCFRRSTATSRRRIRCAASRGRFEATAHPEARLPEPGLRRLRVQLSAGVAAACGAAQHPRKGCDFVGLGRIALSYPDLPADVLSGAPLQAQARSAERSATAPPVRAWAWCRAAIPWIRSTRPARGDQNSQSAHAIEDRRTRRARRACACRRRSR